MNLKSLFCKSNKIKNKAQRTANNQTKIVNGLSSASTNLTNEKCNAHNEDNTKSSAIFLFSLNFSIQSLGRLFLSNNHGIAFS